MSLVSASVYAQNNFKKNKYSKITRKFVTVYHQHYPVPPQQ